MNLKIVGGIAAVVAILLFSWQGCSSQLTESINIGTDCSKCSRDTIVLRDTIWATEYIDTCTLTRQDSLSIFKYWNDKFKEDFPELYTRDSIIDTITNTVTVTKIKTVYEVKEVRVDSIVRDTVKEVTEFRDSVNIITNREYAKLYGGFYGGCEYCPNEMFDAGVDLSLTKGNWQYGVFKSLTKPDMGVRLSYKIAQHESKN